MDKSIEAMKLALEALEGFYEYGYDRQECFEHITAIKEALLEHAMQEVQRLGQEIERLEIKTTDPFESSRVGDYNRGWNDCLFATGIVKRTEQPAQRKPLTKEQIEPMATDLLGYGALLKQDMELFTKAVRAVEAAHGIKENT